jgi:hypothetical protein
MRGLMNDIFLDDLKAKTHRGMAGQALKGFSTGSRVYGYRRVPIEDPARKDDWGRPVIVAVKREIDEDKAQWVRQMFQWYADGKSLRWIASELNRLHIPTPGAQDRRKHPSKIAGLWFTRRLAGGGGMFTGILENPTYIGKVIWNRREWLKDPETKRKHARLRPDTEWITTEGKVEPIVSTALWQAVQARLQNARRYTEAPTRGRGPKFLLSGLLRCGTCHRRFVVTDSYRYGCPAHRVQGCPNGVAVARTLVEEKILSGIRHELFSSEGIELFVKETTRLLRERQRLQRPDPTASQKQLAKGGGRDREHRGSDQGRHLDGQHETGPRTGGSRAGAPSGCPAAPHEDPRQVDRLFTECHGALPCARGRPRCVAAPTRRAGAGADQDIGGRDYLVADTGWVSRSGIDGELRGVPQAGRGSVWPTIWSPK